VAKLVDVPGIQFVTWDDVAAHASSLGATLEYGVAYAVGPNIEAATICAKTGKTTVLPGSHYVGGEAGVVPFATNPELQTLIKQLWKPGASVGDGSTFDAVEFEATTGRLVGGRTHFQKLSDSWQNLTKIVKRGNLSEDDQAVAEELDERFLQATMTIEQNPDTAAAANILAGKLPDAGLPGPAVDYINSSARYAALDGAGSTADGSGGAVEDLENFGGELESFGGELETLGAELESVGEDLGNLAGEVPPM
jgi:hypothetical protein